MDLEAARTMGVELMAVHGLSGWTLEFDDAKVRAGLCRFDRRTISLSRPLTVLYGRSQVRETLLHEIAHALAGPGHGHGAVWRATARRIGSTGARCVAPEAPRAPAPWVGTCPNGHSVTRHRQPARASSCTRCSRDFSPDLLFTWRFHGREVPMSAGYRASEREIADQRAVIERLAALTAAARDGRSRTGTHAPTLWDSDDDPVAEGDGTSSRAVLAALGGLPVGSTVALRVRGKYAGVQGVVEKRGRTRYHVRTRAGLLTVPFRAVLPVGA
ncbi:SprT-like domain-containing protein [Georgenia sp. MJ206]|uniref:SprT-like domain-containing protein n=1 Tax=Georgenia wangjunii TaxID=3117730 RepID=UPI002F2698E0